MKKPRTEMARGFRNAGVSWTYALAVSLLRSTTVGVAMKMEL